MNQPRLSREKFADPPAEYRTAPFWSWNGDLRDEELRRQIREMRAGGMGGFFMHPRGGMTVEYLGPDYLRAVRTALTEAERLGMRAWLYDEDRFPSGGAGGRTVKGRPEFRQKALEMAETPCRDYRRTEGEIGLFHLPQGAAEEGEPRPLSPAEEEVKTLTGSLLIFRVVPLAEQLLWNNQSYPDLCHKPAVDSFLVETHEVYRREIGASFGGLVPGIFTDEPHFHVDGRGRARLPWTRDFLEEFRTRKGYDIRRHLPQLFQDRGDYRRVRFDYWDVMATLFRTSFTANIHAWCERYGLKFTGHFWEHEFPSPNFTGSTMPNYEFMHYPGIDMLFNTREEKNQVGNELIVKEAASVAGQLGKERVLSETYGASGWDLSLADQKRIADWQFALGVNFICQHLVHYALDGERKRDFPLSFGEHQPWWRDYRLLGDYLARVSYALAQGEPCADILVVHPYGSIWAEYNPAMERQETVDRIAASVKDLCRTLCAHRFFFDLGDEDLLARHGRVEGGRLIVGRMTYRVVILPAMTLLRTSTFKLLKAFAAGGGRIAAIGETPHLLDGVEDGEVGIFFAGGTVTRIEPTPAELRRLLTGWGAAGARLEEAEGKDLSRIYALKRLFPGGEEFYFLCHVDREGEACRARLRLAGTPYVETWDAESGKVKPSQVCTDERGAYVEMIFHPQSSFLLLVDAARTPGAATARVPAATSKEITLGDWRVQRLQPNILPLKLCRCALGDEDWGAEEDVLSADWRLHERLGFEPRSIFMRQPWMFTPAERARKVKVKALYTFRAEGAPIGRLHLALEAPETWRASLNGRPLTPGGGYLHDRAFVLHPADGTVRNGRNELVLTTEDYGIESGLEAVYVAGDFQLARDDKGFCLVPEDRPSAGDWTERGYPYYTGVMRYTAGFSLRREAGRAYRLSLGQLWMAAARVYVNGRLAKLIGWPPYELEITELLRDGENEVAVEVANSLQNMLGPHNGRETPGFATPGSFYAGDGDVRFTPSGFEGQGSIRIS